MAHYTFKKIGRHLGICVLIWIIIAVLSPDGHRYAGWISGFFGACYLLAGWLSVLKGKGTDLSGILRRKRPPEVPYYLRGPEKSRKPKLSLNGNRHVFDDDPERALSEHSSAVPQEQRDKCDACVFIAVGVCLLILSAF